MFRNPRTTPSGILVMEGKKKERSGKIPYLSSSTCSDQNSGLKKLHAIVEPKVGKHVVL
jgi:hypothetical protein